MQKFKHFDMQNRIYITNYNYELRNMHMHEHNLNKLICSFTI